jgi:mRNA-degrading endonuclease toxin of MazEF toxin-antitoxin module
MVDHKKGDVVLVSFPAQQVDGRLQTRRRPAVVVSNDHNNARLEEVWVVPLTSNSSRLDRDYGLAVAMDSPEGQAAGLRLDCVIDCRIIATIPKTSLVSKIGAFSLATVNRIDECIKRNIDQGDAE